MKKFISEILEIVRPFGLRRLVITCGMLLVQAIAQMVAVFSILPFLNAAADSHGFRESRLGSAFIGAIGGGSDQRVLVAAGVTSLLLLLGGNMVTLLVDWLRGRYAFYIGHQIRVQLITRLLSRRYEYFGSLNSSVLLKNLVEDVMVFTQTILIPSLDILARTMLALLLAISMVLMEPFVSLCAAGIIGVYFLVAIRPLRRVASRTSTEIKVSIRALYYQVSQTFAGIKPILASEAQEYFRDRIRSASWALSEIMPRTLVLQSVPRVGLEVLVFGGLILWVLISLLTGADLVSLMPRVGVTALIAYRLMPSLQLIFAQSVGMATMRQSMDEVLRLIREQGLHASGSVELDGSAVEPLEWKHEFRFEDVGFSYAGADRPVVENISFTIVKGEHVAFVGPTGSGKSTLIDLILGLLEPGEGRILVDGERLAGHRCREWRGAIGYVPQELFLLDTSIAENVAFGHHPDALDIERVRAVSEQAEALDFVEEQGIGGFWRPVGERGGKLSGGQRQRLALARALYRQPSVLVLDEATSALDPRTEKKVMQAVLDVGEALTIITVAHRLNTVKACDRIYFIEDGRISASGTYDELVANHAKFRHFAQ